MSPAAVPTATPTAMASTPGMPAPAASFAAIIMERIATAPTERSIPAVRMISVCPTASAPITATCCTTSESELGEANLGLSVLNATNERTRTRNGLIAGWECSACWMRCTGERCRSANCSLAELAGWPVAGWVVVDTRLPCPYRPSCAGRPRRPGIERRGQLAMIRQIPSKASRPRCCQCCRRRCRACRSPARRRCRRSPGRSSPAASVRQWRSA